MSSHQPIDQQEREIVSIPLEEVVQALGLRVVFPGRGHIKVASADLNRPGLQFAGYYGYFDAERMQVVGHAEHTYLEAMSTAERQVRMCEFFSHSIPAIVVTWDDVPHPELLECAAHADCPVLISPQSTSRFIQRAVSFLGLKFASVETRHGVLVDVYGVGIMLIGSSGIGKSETALELVKRGHRLVADDAVEIRRVADQRLSGQAPELIRHLVEVRGVGIVDVQRMYGVASVISHKSIDMVIELQIWNDDTQYDRLGNQDDTIEILGVKIPRIMVPVAPGRNLAIICEVAARNYRLKRMGYSALDELNRRMFPDGDQD